jgi:predicted secreted acid phosphatase
MKSFFQSKPLLLFLSFFLLNSGIYAEPANLSIIKKQIIAYHDAGDYEKELTNKIEKAQRYILQQARSAKQKQKLAIVLDIDETSLSNYASLVKRDFADEPARVHKDMLKADAEVIKPMLNLYNNALKHNIHVFFVTGRSRQERKATITNLHKAGYRNWSGLYLKPWPSKESARQYKTRTRAEITKKGYFIIATIGDQYSDIQGGYACKGFKLPNPFYYIP